MSGIIWLGSYPRSGNTWFRILLEHLLADASAPFDPRRPRVRNAAARELIDSALGIETSDLTHDEVDRLRPLAYERIARESRDEPLFLKTHDAWVEGADGRITLSRSATRGAIYLIRDPRDVAVSLAFHLGCDLDDAIHRLTSADDALARHTSRGNVQTRQKLLGWSGHVESWTGPRGPSPYVVRYEDLVSAPEETFAHALLACGIDVSASQVEAAVDATRFEKLRAIEDESGFPERGRRSRRFFRSGRVGSWREHLSDRQRARIIAAHGSTMARFGYSDEIDAAPSSTDARRRVGGDARAP